MQQRIAEINDGVVNSIIIAGDGTNYDPDKLLPVPGYVEAPAEVEPGWTYQDGQFVPPLEPEPPTLDEAKAQKRAELKTARDAVIAEGFTYGDHVFPLDPDVSLSLTQQFIGSQAMPARHYAWKDIDNIYRDIGDAATFQAFAMSMMLYGQSVYAREEMLQNYINNKDDIDVVLGVTWETVPDEPV